MTIAEEKNNLRHEVRSSERRLPNLYKMGADWRINANVLILPEYQSAKRVFCFIGTSREINTRRILLDAIAQGKTLCVPLCTGVGEMELRIIRSLDQLRTGAYGIMEPCQSAPKAVLSEIDLSIIPCVSCDYKGNRLGQGGGYYDHFFAAGTEKTIMLCREKLIRVPIPREQHDLIFPRVITEEGLYQGERLICTAPLV